jgi:hypothetical protein
VARPGLCLHPKFLRLCHLLREPAPRVLGHLEFLWMTAYEAGDPEIGDETAVELAAGWYGEPGAFFKSVAECGGAGRAGFIEEISSQPGRWQVHDLFDHAPDYVQRRMQREYQRRAKGQTLSDLRAEAGRKGAAAKWAKANAANDGKLIANVGGCQSDDSKCLTNVKTPAPAPAPAPAPKKEKKPAGAGDIPAGLLELIDGWNELGEQIVKQGNGAKRDRPAKETLKGWDRAMKDPDQRKLLADIPVLLTAVRGATFCHGQGWFTLPWLFGKNKNGELNIVRLSAGAYNSGGNNAQRQSAISPGQVHDPNATGGWS